MKLGIAISRAEYIMAHLYVDRIIFPIMIMLFSFSLIIRESSFNLALIKSDLAETDALAWLAYYAAV